MNTLLAHILIISTLDLVGIIFAKYWSITKNPWLLAVTVVLFGGAGFFFARSLRFDEGAAIINILWISISVVLVTIVSYFLFKEQITPLQFTGIVLIAIGLGLVSWK